MHEFAPVIKESIISSVVEAVISAHVELRGSLDVFEVAHHEKDSHHTETTCQQAL